MISKQTLIIRCVIIHLVLSGLLFASAELIALPNIPIISNLFIALNVSAFAVFGYDKYVSSRNELIRLPEMFFYLITFFGASAGIFLGAFLFRHKTLKPTFMATVGIILLAQLSIAFLLREF